MPRTKKEPVVKTEELVSGLYKMDPSKTYHVEFKPDGFVHKDQKGIYEEDGNIYIRHHPLCGCFDFIRDTYHASNREFSIFYPSTDMSLLVNLEDGQQVFIFSENHAHVIPEPECRFLLEDGPYSVDPWYESHRDGIFYPYTALFREYDDLNTKPLDSEGEGGDPISCVVGFIPAI